VRCLSPIFNTLIALFAHGLAQARARVTGGSQSPPNPSKSRSRKSTAATAGAPCKPGRRLPPNSMCRDARTPDRSVVEPNGNVQCPGAGHGRPVSGARGTACPAENAWLAVSTPIASLLACHTSSLCLGIGRPWGGPKGVEIGRFGQLPWKDEPLRYSLRRFRKHTGRGRIPAAEGVGFAVTITFRATGSDFVQVDLPSGPIFVLQRAFSVQTNPPEPESVRRGPFSCST
jgi:hypothetical protein